MLGNNMLQRTIDPVGMHVAKAKRDDAGQCMTAGSYKFSKTQVVDK